MPGQQKLEVVVGELGEAGLVDGFSVDLPLRVSLREEFVVPLATDRPARRERSEPLAIAVVCGLPGDVVKPVEFAVEAISTVDRPNEYAVLVHFRIRFTVFR